MFRRLYRIPEAQTATLYRPQEGDVVVLEFDGLLSEDQAVKIHAKVDAKFAPVRVVCLGSGARVSRGL